MRVTKLYVRFFKSFNFDYERKANAKAEPRDWELIDGSWFPFIRVPLDSEVTAVVGANESGKSHLIAAIKQALTGEGIDRSDFCRYSPLFSVEAGAVRVPDFGLEIEMETVEDVELLEGLGVGAKAGDSVVLLRLSGESSSIVFEEQPHEVESSQLDVLQQALPTPFQLATSVPLPDSITFDALLGREAETLTDRKLRKALLGILTGLQ